jgi:L-amino acid N-acyltransferase YncA
MPDLVSIRPAAAEDAEAIARVQVDTWRVAYSGSVPDAFLDDMDVGERAARWREAIAQARGTWVAEAGGKVVGFVAFGLCRDGDAFDAVGELYAIYVLADRWRGGVGTALHDVCLRELRRCGFEQATLWALDANPAAKAFYEARGWEADGATAPHDFAGTELPVVRYRRPL